MENQTKYLRNILKMNVKFYEKNVKYLFLPAAFLSKGFISGKSAPSCNYEEYLVEFLDKSTYFRHRTDFAHIKLNEKQDRGQSDIEEDGFSLDFKLIGGQSAITARRHTSQSIMQISEDVVGYGLADGKKDSYEAVRIHLALRIYSSRDLQELLKNNSKGDTIQRDVVLLLKNLIVDKNLLLFLPYALLVDDTKDCTADEIVVAVLEDCFGSAFELRNKMVPTKETFFCCIYNQAIVFYKCIGARLLRIDCVETHRSDTFRTLARYYDSKPEIINAIIDETHLWDE